MSVINVRTIYILKDQWDICLLLEFSCTLEKKKRKQKQQEGIKLGGLS